MQSLLSETKNKILSVIIVTMGAFLGFEALSFALGIFQLDNTFYLSLYIYVFHIFWLTFLFDLHLKKRGVLAAARLNHQGVKIFWMAFLDRIQHLRNWHYLRHYQNYLVLPGLIYWGTVVLMFMDPFNSTQKQALAICSTIALGVAYWYMKEHVSRNLEHQDHWILTLSLVKLYAAFIIFSSTVGVTFHYGFTPSFLFLAVATLTFLLVYQALFQHRLLSLQILLFTIGIAIVVGLLSLWVYVNWSSEYFTAGLVMLAVYNFLWGILHHHLDHTLTKKVVVEYLAMMILIITFVFASHNFNQKVL